MEDFRYPKICFFKLKRISENVDIRLLKFNWYMQVEKIFSLIDRKTELDNLTLESIQRHKNTWISDYEKLLREEHIRRLEESRSLQVLPYLPRYEGLQKYLYLKIPLKYFSLLAQIRTLNNYRSRIIINRKILKMKSTGFCFNCGSPILNRMYHMLIECRSHESERECCFGKIEDEIARKNALFEILSNREKCETVKKIYLFVKSLVDKQI